MGAWPQDGAATLEFTCRITSRTVRMPALFSTPSSRIRSHDAKHLAGKLQKKAPKRLFSLHAELRRPQAPSLAKPSPAAAIDPITPSLRASAPAAPPPPAASGTSAPCL